MYFSRLSAYKEKSYTVRYEKLSLFMNSEIKWDMEFKLDDISYRDSRGVAKMGYAYIIVRWLLASRFKLSKYTLKVSSRLTNRPIIGICWKVSKLFKSSSIRFFVVSIFQTSFSLGMASIALLFISFSKVFSYYISGIYVAFFLAVLTACTI